MRQYVSPSNEEVAESRASFEQCRAEMDALREAARPARRVAILAGPALRDVDTAVDCMCSCHPRPADVHLHDGGQSCRCQETEAEHAARRETILKQWSELSEDFADEERFDRQQRQLVAEEAAALGVEARIEVWAAPFVVVGVCDGRGFYLRERHGSYRVTIAPDEDPGSNPWAAEPTEPSIDIAAGDDSELQEDGRFSRAVALRVAVQTVRTALARNACDHRSVDSEPYCPSCGVRLEDAEVWRWTGGTNGYRT